MKELIALAIQETPAIIEAFKSLHQAQNPGAPVLTNEEVIAAYNAAFTSSLLQDDQWLAIHGDPPAA